MADDRSIERGGSRTIPLIDLHRLPGGTPHLDTVLESDELIVRIRIPTTPLGKASTYQKIRDRESYAFAVVSSAVAVIMEDGLVRDARIALGGVATKPWRATAAEQSLVGRPLMWETALHAGTVAFADARPRKASQFKQSLGPRCVARALMIARQRSEA